MQCVKLLTILFLYVDEITWCSLESNKFCSCSYSSCSFAALSICLSTFLLKKSTLYFQGLRTHGQSFNATNYKRTVQLLYTLCGPETRMCKETTNMTNQDTQGKTPVCNVTFVTISNL